jgi:hypothetical protein
MERKGHVGNHLRGREQALMASQELRDRLETARDIAEPLKRRLFVLGVITSALQPYGVRPILVGGGAVEYYTFGGYSTNDTDLAVSDHQRLDEVLGQLGFRRVGRFWLRDALDSVVESPAGVLEGEDAPLTCVEVDGLTAFVLGVEDLTIDRLNGFVHCHWKADGRWAERLIALHGADMDWGYLHRRAQAEGTDAQLSRMEKAWQEGRLG